MGLIDTLLGNTSESRLKKLRPYVARINALEPEMQKKSDAELLADILNDQFAAIFEYNKMGSCIREFCRNAAVDADGCTYTYWDSGVDTGQPSKGAIRTEVLMNTQVMFGNPNSRDVQSQPYFLFVQNVVLGGDQDHGADGVAPVKGLGRQRTEHQGGG